MNPIAKLLPYFIVERIILKYQSDSATLKLPSGTEYMVSIYETDPGTWIVKSRKVELQLFRKKLESLIDQTDEKLEEFKEEP